jgi:hypothetical protein
MMAKKLLSHHMNAKDDEHKIDEIVDNFTSKLFYHGHPISRDEARNHLGLSTVQNPPMRVENAMWRLHLDYERELKMETPFDPAGEFVSAFPNLAVGMTAMTPIRTAKMVYVESTAKSDIFSLDYELSGTKAPDGTTSVTSVVRRQGWGVE